MVLLKSVYPAGTLPRASCSAVQAHICFVPRGFCNEASARCQTQCQPGNHRQVVFSIFEWVWSVIVVIRIFGMSLNLVIFDIGDIVYMTKNSLS